MEIYDLFLKWKQLPKGMTASPDYIDNLWREWRRCSPYSFLVNKGSIKVNEAAFREILEFERFDEWVTRRQFLVTSLFGYSEESEKVFLAFNTVTNRDLESASFPDKEITEKMKKKLIEKAGKDGQKGSS